MIISQLELRPTVVKRAADEVIQLVFQIKKGKEILLQVSIGAPLFDETDY